MLEASPVENRSLDCERREQIDAPFQFNASTRFPMRRIALMLTVLAVFGLAACNKSSPNGNGKAQAQVAHSVTGTVGLMSPIQLSPKATMLIKLVDASADQAAPLASKTISPVGSMPVDFTLDFDPTKINPAHIYLVKVDLSDGDRTFSMPVQAPVITHDAGTSKVEIRLTANKTPKEKLEDKYSQLQTNLGGYAISNGRQLEKHESRGWQTFRDNDSGKIVFVRENIEYQKDGFANNEYAYKDGTPWFIVTQHKSSQNAKAADVRRVGWNEDGKLVVNAHKQNGKTGTLSDKEVAALKSQAEDMLKLARAKSPAKKKKK
jgi:putative lipoprotein